MLGLGRGRQTPLHGVPTVAQLHLGCPAQAEEDWPILRYAYTLFFLIRNFIQKKLMNKLVETINSPFWGAAILTIILLTAGDYKWWLFGLFVLFALFGKLYFKHNE